MVTIHPRSRVFALLAIIAWVGILFFLGSVSWSLGGPEWAEELVEPIGHYVFHFVLAALIYRFTSSATSDPDSRVRAAAIAIIATLSIGLSLEVLQLFLPKRGAEVSDILSDAAGAVSGTAAFFLPEHFKINRAFVYVATSIAGFIAIALVSGMTIIMSAPGFPHVEDCGTPPRLPDSESIGQKSPRQDSTTFRAIEGTISRNERVADGLVVLYNFSEGSGGVVHDISGVEPVMDLIILDTSKVHWLPDTNGVEFISRGSAIKSRSGAAKILSLLSAANRFTVEAWLTPRSLEQGGPVRIVTMSEGWSKRQVNFHLGQSETAASFRLRTICEAFTWTTFPEVFTDTTRPTNLIVTFDGTHKRLIADGALHEISEPLEGDFSNWDSGYPLIIGNEATLDRSYLGRIFLIAIYDRVLSMDEIRQNFDAGPYSKPTSR